MKLPKAILARARATAATPAPKVKVPRGPVKPVTLNIDDLRLVSEMNARDPWQVRNERRKRQRSAVMFASLPDLIHRIHAMPLPVVVTITRIGPRTLDDDNLRGSAKFVRDAVAHMLGIDDGDAMVSWRYEQEKFKRYGVRIKIASIASGQGAGDA